jgi:hypothetical protein
MSSDEVSATSIALLRMSEEQFEVRCDIAAMKRADLCGFDCGNPNERKLLVRIFGWVCQLYAEAATS